jgi:hypothetical protein
MLGLRPSRGLPPLIAASPLRGGPGTSRSQRTRHGARLDSSPRLTRATVARRAGRKSTCKFRNFHRKNGRTEVLERGKYGDSAIASSWIDRTCSVLLAAHWGSDLENRQDTKGTKGWRVALVVSSSTVRSGSRSQSGADANHVTVGASVSASWVRGATTRSSHRAG